MVGGKAERPETQCAFGGILRNMADRLSVDEIERLAAEAGRSAYEAGLCAGLPVVTTDERTGKAYLEQNGRRFEVELMNGEIKILSEISRLDAA